MTDWIEVKNKREAATSQFQFKENGVSSNANEDMRSSLIYEAKIKEIDTKFVYL